jgi:hypothetical protein
MIKILGTFLTFCSISSALASTGDLEFDSPALSKFYSIAKVVKAIPFENQQVCSIKHEKIKVASVSPNITQNWIQQVKSKIAQSDGVSVERVSLLSDSQTDFRSVHEVLDNTYCFPFFNGSSTANQARTKLLGSYDDISQNVEVFLYYYDGYDSSSASQIYLYVVDPSVGDVYKLKGFQTSL